jgi:site-specific recombinase XerD
MTLSVLIDRATRYLCDHDYAPGTIDNYAAIWRALSGYAQEHQTQVYTVDLGRAFLEDHYRVKLEAPRSQYHVALIRAMRVLQDLQHQDAVRSKYPIHPRPLAGSHRLAYDRYAQELTQRGLSPRTVDAKLATLNHLNRFLEQAGITNLSDLTVTDIGSYVQTLARYAGTTREEWLYRVRDILRFFVREGLVAAGLADLFPRIPTYAQDPLPSVYSREEITTILQSIDRTCPVGKRDYAILLLAARLGMRIGDIHQLRWDHIQWAQDCISYVQQKTQASIVLPLVQDVKLALLDYWKNGRPSSELPQVFLTTKAPYGVATPTDYYHVLQKYRKCTGMGNIPPRKRGLHSLRHSLASQLLADNTPIAVITGILGHQQPDTTRQYLKIDEHHLRRLALEVPHEAP